MKQFKNKSYIYKSMPKFQLCIHIYIIYNIYHIQKHAQKQTKHKPNEKSKNIQALLNLNQFDLSLRMPLFHLVSVIRSLFPVPFDFQFPVTP